MPAATPFAAFEGRKYLSLETFRRNGQGVRTPVWFAAVPAPDGGTTLFVYAAATSGKAKRLRRTSAVKIAPCDVRGRVTGGWTDARAELVEGAAFEQGMRAIDRKYWPVKQLLDLGTRLFSRHQRAMVAIRLT